MGTKFDKLHSAVKADIPGFELLDKKESKLLAFASKFMFWNKNFMETTVTTMGNKIYWPTLDKKMKDSVPFLATFAHEWLHLKHIKKGPVMHLIGYVMPQILAVLSLVSLGALSGNLWWLFNLIWLGFLAPIPAYWRKAEEFEAMCVSIAIKYWMTGTIPYYDWKIAYFSNSFYYWMWPFKKSVKKEFETFIKNLKDDKLTDELRDIKKAIVVKG